MLSGVLVFILAFKINYYIINKKTVEIFLYGFTLNFLFAI